MGKRSTLNKAGIRQLADDLVANKKRYNQQTFGDKEDCGTVCCLAGFCSIRSVGLRKFNKWIDDESDPVIDPRGDGAKQLGIPRNADLFDYVDSWPSDLGEEYRENGPRGRVIVALKALQRMREDGSIDPDPKKVHTKLPQLKELLASKR
jgi:hypothetical protein